MCGSRWGVSSLHGSPFLLLEGRQQARNVRPGNGNSRSAGFIIEWGFQERQEYPFHGWASIQIHADGTLRLGQREQGDLQRQKLDSCVDIPRTVKVPTEAFQRLDRLSVLLLCQKDTHQH